MRTAPFLFLLCQPIRYAVILEVVEFIDQVLVVGNTVFNVDILELLQSPAGKIKAFKTPPHPMLPGTLAKAVAAFYAGGHQVVRMAAVAAYLLEGKTISLGPSFQLTDIVYPMGKVAGAITTVNTANPNEFPIIFFHTVSIITVI